MFGLFCRDCHVAARFRQSLYARYLQADAMRRTSVLLIGHSSYLSIWPVRFTCNFQSSDISSSLRFTFLASMGQKGQIDQAVSLMQKCEDHFTTLKYIPTHGLLWASEVQKTVWAKDDLRISAKSKIKEWEENQSSCAIDPKVADALKALKNLETSLRTGESLPLPKSSAYRSADSSKTVCGEFVDCTRFYLPAKTAVEESKGKIVNAMENLNIVLFSSDLNSGPNDSKPQLIELFPSANTEENNLPTSSERQLVLYSRSD